MTKRETELFNQLKSAVDLLVALRDCAFSDQDWREVDDLERYIQDAEAHL